MPHNRNKKSTTLMCFSPPVMIATFVIEVGLLVFVLWKNKLDSITKLIVSILLSLALFQLAEYSVCEGLAFSGDTWSKIGFVAITVLPPLGIHLISVIAGKTNRNLIGLAYATGTLWMGAILIFDLFDGFGCSGNYVIFHLKDGLYIGYGLFYYGWLLVGASLATHYGRLTRSKYRRRALYASAIGYISFLLPTTSLNLIKPETTSGIPSIMCGFALILAFILALYALPNYTKVTKKS